MPQVIHLKSTGDRVSAHMQFVKYGAANGKERSGAYLFLPDGAAKVWVTFHLFFHSPTKFVLDSTTFLYVLVVGARLRNFVFIIVEAIAKYMNRKSTHSFR